MWKRGGRSSALDRAQALLSAKRSSGGDAQGSRQESAAKTQVSVGESYKTRSAPPKTHSLFSDLSDLSSVSSAPESGRDAVKVTDVEKNHGREMDSNKDLRPQSSVGEGSRFLKKVPPPTNSSQSPVRRTQMHPESESRYVSSSRRATQTAALTRLAEIESRIRSRSRKQAQEQARQETKSALILTSDFGISSPTPARVTQTPEASVQLSVQSSGDQSLRGNHFLKKKAAGAVESTNISRTVAPKSVDVSVRSRSRSSDRLETKSVRLMSGVSLESDEEDMRKLLGDSIDSTDYSFLRPGRPSSAKKPDKVFSKSSHQFHSTRPPAEVLPSPPSNTAPPRSPAPPSHRSSPFRFTGHAQARFSPSVLSPLPSPPRVSPSPERPGSSYRPESPQRSLSSASGHSEVLSLEELFPVDPGSERPHSEMSSVSSEDFKINVMTLDDLAPAHLGFTAEMPGKQREAKQGCPVPGSPDRNQQLQEEEQQQEELLDYKSDFESESKAEPDYSASQVSEDLQRNGAEEKVVSEVRDEALDLDVSHGRTEDDYSSTFSDTSHSSTSQTSDCSHTSQSYSQKRSEDSLSHESRTSSKQSRRRTSTRKVLKEAAAQTQPDPLASTWPTGISTMDPTVHMTYMNPSPAVTHTLSAEMVEAISAFNPAVFALNELLKQQLAMTRRFIESSRHLHSTLVQSLEPPNYRYTTLEDTKKFICKHRSPKLTMKEALEEVLQEMRDDHCM